MFTKYNFCRICLRKIKTGFHIFSDKQESNEVLNKLFTTFSVVITFDKSLPRLICKDCLEELNIAYRFRLKINNFPNRLATLLKTQLDDENSEDNLKSDIQLDIHEVCQVEFENNLQDSNLLPLTIIKEKNEDDCINLSKKPLLAEEEGVKDQILVHTERNTFINKSDVCKNRLFYCNKCTYSTPHRRTLTNHLRRHNGEKPHICHCGKSFTQIATLIAHKKTHSDEKFFTCSTCGKQFKHKYSLKTHLYVHEDGSFECSICKKVLKSNRNLKDHMRRHNNVYNFNCEECGKTFVTSSELYHHKQKHSLIIMECNLCSFKTPIKNNLIIHIKRHTGEKPYKCHICTAAFFTTWDLKRHITVHTQEKRFFCPVCNQRFTQSNSVNKHIKVVHELRYKQTELNKTNAQNGKLLKSSNKKTK